MGIGVLGLQSPHGWECYTPYDLSLSTLRAKSARRVLLVSLIELLFSYNYQLSTINCQLTNVTVIL